MSKKEESRFNIRFNPADPVHQIAIDVLSHAGRSKANLIANALAFYLKCAGDESAAYITETLTLGKVPKIKSEKRRNEKTVKPRTTAFSDGAKQHEVIMPVETETSEISQIPASSFEDGNESEGSNELLEAVSPEVQGAVLGMLDMFRG